MNKRQQKKHGMDRGCPLCGASGFVERDYSETTHILKCVNTCEFSQIVKKKKYWDWEDVKKYYKTRWGTKLTKKQRLELIEEQWKELERNALLGVT